MRSRRDLVCLATGGSELLSFAGRVRCRMLTTHELSSLSLRVFVECLLVVYWCLYDLELHS